MRCLTTPSSANSFTSEVVECEASVESTLVRKVASSSERTITATLGELTVVNDDDGHDEVTSKTTEKKADLGVAKHSPKREAAVARSTRFSRLTSSRPQRFRQLQMDTTRAVEKKIFAA